MVAHWFFFCFDEWKSFIGLFEGFMAVKFSGRFNQEIVSVYFQFKGLNTLIVNP